jgi:tripartite-type tricarboxylate transporter receptor subunit TctC
MSLTRRAALAGGGLAMLTVARPALAQPALAQAAYPSRTIKMIVPYPAGGTTDFLGRLVADQLKTGLGATVIVENKPGAGTTLGADQVARAEPDGYTLLMATSTTLAINKTLYKKLPYDPVKDFTPIALVAGVPFALIVNPQVPARTLSEFIAYAKSTPGLAYGSAGNGSPQHLGAEMLKAAAAIDIRHVPYRGSVPAMLDVIAGHIPFMVVDLQPALPQISEGKVRVLGVTTPRRVAVAPDIPTLAEAGLGGVAGRGRARRRAAGDRRPIGRADCQADGRSGNARKTHHDCAGAAGGFDAGQFCRLHQDRGRSLGRHRQKFGRRAGMTRTTSSGKVFRTRRDRCPQ